MGHVNVDYQRGVDAGADTVIGLSGFWGDCPILASVENRRKAFGFIEDGLGVPDLGASGQSGRYDVTMDATGTPNFGSDARSGGGLIIKTGTADNDEINWVYGGATAAPFRISDASSEKAKLWYEFAILPSLITATQNGWFMGLCEVGGGALDALIDDDGTIDAARDLVGFFKPEGDAGTVDFIYQKGAQTLQTVLNGFKTLNTTTPTKLGFVYDPNAPAAEQIRIYTDGIPETTFVTGTNIAAATFPDAILMAPTGGIKGDTAAAAQTIKIPFWGCYQLRV